MHINFVVDRAYSLQLTGNLSTGLTIGWVEEYAGLFPHVLWLLYVMNSQRMMVYTLALSLLSCSSHNNRNNIFNMSTLYVYQLDNKHASYVMYLDVVQSCDCVLV